MSPDRYYPRILVVVLTLLISGVEFGRSQPSPQAESGSEPIIQFLEQTIEWYRQLDLQRQMAVQPGDIMLVSEDRQLADQVVRLAFDFARAEAESGGKQGGGDQGAESARYQALSKLTATLDQQIKGTRAELESLRQKLIGASGRQRQALQTQIAETQSEIDLAQTRRDSMSSMLEFVGGSSTGGLGATGLRARIEALARSVPAALTKPSGSAETPSIVNVQPYPATSAGASKSEPTGIWGLTADLFALSRKKHTLADTIQLTDSLAQTTKDLRTPLVNSLRQMSRRGDDLAKQADSANQAELAQEKKDFDALTAQFKGISTALLPLSKLGILLDLYRKNLASWQTEIQSQYTGELRSLAVRLVFLIIILALVIGAAELWRRTIFRYIQDLHRRYQLLLLRRIVFWCIVSFVILFSFANELGSVATFAGLMTAGVAVALQNVILSIAGYFFLIGKFGIRVGDCVQVSGVVGEVVDIGLVRFHLLELISGGGKTPSGRVVAFSNSIVFQSTAGLFKQIPGTSFIWHEITVALSPDSDYGSVEKRLRGAVETVFSDYHEEMEQQHRHMQRTLTAVPMGTLRPTSRLRFTQSSLEVVIRYPVDLQRATEIDDRVTRELIRAIEQEPKLQPTGSGGPSIRLRSDLSNPASTS